MSLWQTIAEVQPTLPGWCVPEKAEALASIVLALRPQVSVEIGIFGGSSFIPIALAHKHIGFGMAHGIDAWDASVSAKDEIPINAKWCIDQDYGKLYNDFMAKLRQLGLENCTRIFRMNSDDVPTPNEIDLLHTDGSHVQQAIRDTERFASRVRVGGICVMDDLDWDGGNVRVAENRLIGMGFIKLYPLGTGAVYQRVVR